MNCKYCDLELPQGSNPRRQFCNDAHKQAYWRQQQKQEQDAALLAELEQLRSLTKEQAQTIEDIRRTEVAPLSQELEAACQRIAELEQQVQAKTLVEATTLANLHKEALQQIVGLRGALAAKERELEAARQQISQFTAQVQPSQSKAVAESADSDLVPLVRFAGDHFINRGEAERRCKTGMIAHSKVPTSKGTQQLIMLDARGRHDFWVQFQSSGDFRSCDDCPHNIPAAKPQSRKPSYQIYLRHETGACPELPRGFSYAEQPQDISAHQCPAHEVFSQHCPVDQARRLLEQLKSVAGLTRLWLAKNGYALENDSWKQEKGQWVRD